MAAAPYCGSGSLAQAAILTTTRKPRADAFVDDESWRELARRELAAGRDPNLALAAPIEG